MLTIRIHNSVQQEELTLDSGTLELGRAPGDDGPRFVVDDQYVSRDQLRLELTDAGEVRLTNLGREFTLSGGERLARGEVRALTPPVRLKIGTTLVDLSREQAAAPGMKTISPPRSPAGEVGRLSESPTPDKLAHWFETLLSVQRSAAGSAGFYRETAAAVVNLVGLDRGIVLLYKEGQWEPVASHLRTNDSGVQFSHTVLEQAMRQRRTFYQAPSGNQATASLTDIDAVVASPVFDRNDVVVGAVYGSRDLASAGSMRGISPIEAQLVQVLAGAVSAGLSRVEQEAAAARRRVQLEQFVSPEIAVELERNPDLLHGQDQTITMLFSDLCDFSRLSEHLGSTDTYRLLGDVMDQLTSAVLRFGGAVVDYHGDGLAAMWNAPLSQPDHAARACDTALAMVAELPELNQRWSKRLGEPLRLGVGLHTGPALVGNAGSSRRVKYGPRGPAVNLASRVEGATRHVGSPILLTAATREHAALTDRCRRLGQFRLVGIAEAVHLYDLTAEADAVWQARCDHYEQALAHHEQGDPAAALAALARLSEQMETDAAERFLREQVEQTRGESAENRGGVFELPYK